MTVALLADVVFPLPRRNLYVNLSMVVLPPSDLALVLDLGSQFPVRDLVGCTLSSTDIGSVLAPDLGS